MSPCNRSRWSPVVWTCQPKMERLLLLLLSVTCQQHPPVFHLNPDGYIECYDDLDCPDPVQLPNNNTFIEFLLWFYTIIQEISSNGQAVHEIFNSKKSSNLIGPHLPCQGKPGDTILIKTTFAVFLLLLYNITQKMKSNSQAVLEIFKLEKSSNLIG